MMKPSGYWSQLRFEVQFVLTLSFADEGVREPVAKLFHERRFRIGHTEAEDPAWRRRLRLSYCFPQVSQVEVHRVKQLLLRRRGRIGEDLPAGNCVPTFRAAYYLAYQPARPRRDCPASPRF